MPAQTAEQATPHAKPTLHTRTDTLEVLVRFWVNL